MVSEPGNDQKATENLMLLATIDLTLATIGILLDVFVISEGKAGKPYRLNGRLYQGDLTFYLTWGLIFFVLLAQGFMAINLYTAAAKFKNTPLKCFKKITAWQIWSIGFLIVMIGGGIPVFALSNLNDDFYGFTIAYLIAEIVFRLVGLVLVEFNRDLIKRDTFFPRVLPCSFSLASSNTKGAVGLPINAEVTSTPSPPPPSEPAEV